MSDTANQDIRSVLTQGITIKRSVLLKKVEENVSAIPDRAEAIRAAFNKWLTDVLDPSIEHTVSFGIPGHITQDETRREKYDQLAAMLSVSEDEIVELSPSEFEFYYNGRGDPPVKPSQRLMEKIGRMPLGHRDRDFLTEISPSH